MSVLDIFSSPAWASQGGAGLDWMQFFPLVLVMGVMYFVLIRPQQKKTQKHQEMLSSLSKGDYVVTNSGMLGVLQDVSMPEWFSLTLATGSTICIKKQCVLERVEAKSLPKGVNFSSHDHATPEKTVKGSKKTKTLTKKPLRKKTEKAAMPA